MNIGTRWSHDRSHFHFYRTTPAGQRHIPFADEPRKVGFAAKLAIAFYIGMALGAIQFWLQFAGVL